MLNPYDLEPGWLALAIPPDEAEELNQTLAALTDSPAVPFMTELKDLEQLLDERAQTWVQTEQDAQAFCLRLAKLGKTLEAEVESLQAEAGRIAGKIKTRSDRVQTLKAYVREFMLSHGIERLKDTRISVWVSNNSQPSVVVVDEAQVPARFKRAVLQMPLEEVPEGYEKDIKSVDVLKTPILEEVKETGEVVPGVEIVRGKHATWR